METKEILVIVLIVILLLAVGLQTMQLVGLSKAGVVPAMTSATVAPVKTASSGSPSAPTSLQNLPSMVGGC
ncbi:MAG: hypothetical protein AABW90_03260 [Nanoarchaeota archaeon]